MTKVIFHRTMEFLTRVIVLKSCKPYGSAVALPFPFVSHRFMLSNLLRQER
jgi:hypothetical protein